MTSPVICPYCGIPSKIVSGDAIYAQRPDLAQCRRVVEVCRKKELV